MDLYTIGFSGKPARQFFQLLQENGVDLVVDIRLRPDGQLSGFAKKADLAYFLESLNQCGYVHVPVLAPSAEILDDYRKDKNWRRFRERFEQLIDERDIPNSLDRSQFEKHRACLLCSEHKPEQCHRRFVADRLAERWNGVTIHHLI